MRAAFMAMLFVVGLVGWGAGAIAQVPEPAQQIDLDKLSAQADAAYVENLSNSPEGRFLIWQADFERRSWEWHLLTTKIIFVVVLIVVGFGLVVSWLQFRSDILPRSRSDGAEAPAYDITAGLQSVAVKSKTIGAVVLIFSGVFFFLYLSIVYPMTSLVAQDWRPATEPATK